MFETLELVTVVLPMGVGSKKLIFGLLLLVFTMVMIAFLCLSKKYKSIRVFKKK